MINKTTKLMMFFLGLVISLQILSLVVVLYMTWPIDSWTMEKASALGGSYGALSTLFSGLAFWGLIWTILIQRDELKRQRIDAKRKSIGDLLLGEAKSCKNDLDLIRFKINHSLVFPANESLNQWQFFYYAHRLMGQLAEGEITTDLFFKELTSAVMKNIEQLTLFYERLNQACDVARYMLADSEIPIEDLQEIKLLFFSVFSKDIFSLSEHIKTILQAIADKATEGKGLSLFHPLSSILSKIGSIREFEVQEVDEQFVKSWQWSMGRKSS